MPRRTYFNYRFDLPNDWPGGMKRFTFRTHSTLNHFGLKFSPHRLQSVVRNSRKEVMHCMVIMAANEQT